MSVELSQLEAKQKLESLEKENRELRRLKDQLQESRDALRESREKYRQLVENLNEVVYMLDRRAYVTYVSPNVERVGGYRPEEVVGRRYSDFIRPDDAFTLGENFQKILSGAEMVTEHQYITKAGRSLWVMTNARPILANGEAAGVQGVLVDITKRKQAEAALKESEAQYRILFENAGDAIFILEGERFISCNEATVHMFGCESKKDIVGQFPWTFSPSVQPNGSDSEQGARGFIEGALNGHAQNFEWRHLRKDGSPIDTEVSLNRLFVKGKTLVQAILRDVTTRKRSEAALGFQALILNQIQETVTATDLEGRITYVNDAMTRIQKRNREALLGQSVDIYGTDPSRGATQKEILDKTLKHGQWHGEIVNYDADGEESIMDCRTKLIIDETGKPVSLVGTSTDITERKKWEEALRESERQKKLILNATAEKVVYYGTDLRVIWANQSAADSVGSVPEALIGRHCYKIWQHRDEPCPDCIVRKTRDTGSPQQAEVGSPDERVWLMRSYPVFDEAGEVSAMVAFGQDITRHKQFEKENQKLEAQVNQTQKLESIGRLAGGVAHDLNNLLSPILGYGEMVLDDTAEDDPRQKPLAEIASAGRKARGLVRQLLAFSRKQTLQFQNIYINDLLRSFEKLLRRTIREDIAIRMDLSPSIPLIKGDHGQLEQVIMNLAVNAQDAMPHGGELAIETAQALVGDHAGATQAGLLPGSYVMLALRDTGLGMDDETLEHLFEPFYTTKDVEKGTGLGLATSYGIVKQHGGSISVNSRPGKGTTFTIHLPATAETKEESVLPSQPQPGLQGSETILLVEDSAQVRELAEMILHRHGYTILAAESGKQALSLLNRHDKPVQLLLTDMIMPDMNGRQLYERVAGRYPDIRVLYMSGYTEDVIGPHGVMEPQIHFIGKPFTVESLTTQVRKVLDQGESC